MASINLDRIEKLLNPLAESQGLELVDVQHQIESGRAVLRVLLDCETGLTVDHCRLFSREAETLLDVEEVLSGRYFLEVSSPGLNRPLNKPKDFLKFEGKLASIKTKVPLDGRKNFKGTLQGLEQENIKIEVDGVVYRVPMNQVDKAQLVY